MTQEEAMTMVIASIAMEELALSHILNAEGEKLQYILGTLPGGGGPCAGTQDVLEVNRSVTALLEAVMQNQMLLKSKLERVLAACPPPCKPPRPCPPPCSPACPPPCACLKSGLQLAVRRDGLLWNGGCRLPWRQRARRGERIRWDEREPTQIRLDPAGAYAVQCTLNVRGMCAAEGAGSILLRQTPCGVFTEAPPLSFFAKCPGKKPQTLQYAAVLYPRTDGGGEAELSLVLSGRDALCVEQAVLNVTEL